jgi:RimJ/RimL family protein N-acetyltransferase
MQALETARFSLAPLVAADAIRMYVPFCDPSLYFFVPAEPPATMGALTARFEQLEKRRSPDGGETWLNWIVERKPSAADAASDQAAGQWRQPVGLIEVTLFPDNQALIGYFTFREFWGQGICSEALPAVLAHLASAYGVRLFKAEVDSRNFASVRVLEKCGFHIAETVPQADFFKGQRSDEHRMVKVG